MNIENKLIDYANASPETMSEWYVRAHEGIVDYAKIIGETECHVAAAVAITSPRIQVSRNVKLAAGLLTGGDITGLMKSRVTAWEFYLQTGKVSQSGIKVKNFHQNLMGNFDLVTVDVWISRAFSVDYDGPNSPAKSDEVYNRMAGTITRLAHRFGVTPAGFQACIWSGVRQENGIADDEGNLDLRDTLALDGAVC